MTLVIGPPGCGKSTFLKALSGKLPPGSSLTRVGSIFFNDEDIHKSKKFLIQKVAEYIEQNDTHAPTLTVEETFVYSWMSSTGGHHSYGHAIDDEAAKTLNKDDALLSRVNNTIKALGLEGCRRTVIGDDTIRGVSGGQKRRVTAGEMMLTPRQVSWKLFAL